MGYVRKGFEEKIQRNLAKISHNNNDKFKFVKAMYTLDATCELCEKKHLTRTFLILNETTGLTISVGSECVEHFKANGVDIDIDYGAVSRLDEAIKASRTDLTLELGLQQYALLNGPDAKASQKQRTELGKEYLKTIDRSDLIKKYYQAYQIHEAIELYDPCNKGSYIYSEEEFTEIFNSIPMQSFFKKKIEEKERKYFIAEQHKFLETYWHPYYDEIVAKEAIPDEADIARIIEKAKGLNLEERIGSLAKVLIDKQNKLQQVKKEYDWLLSYSGSDEHILSLKRKIQNNQYLYPNQIEFAKRRIALEKKELPLNELEQFMEALIVAEPTKEIYRSIKEYYYRNGSISDRQEWRIRHDYKLLKEEGVIK